MATAMAVAAAVACRDSVYAVFSLSGYGDRRALHFSLHDALPIPIVERRDGRYVMEVDRPESIGRLHSFAGDRKSTRLNSSHITTSYAVFCLKKKSHLDPPHWPQS